MTLERLKRQQDDITARLREVWHLRDRITPYFTDTHKMLDQREKELNTVLKYVTCEIDRLHKMQSTESSKPVEASNIPPNSHTYHYNADFTSTPFVNTSLLDARSVPDGTGYSETGDRLTTATPNAVDDLSAKLSRSGTVRWGITIGSDPILNRHRA
jgi:hypothetical protein